MRDIMGNVTNEYARQVGRTQSSRFAPVAGGGFAVALLVLLQGCASTDGGGGQVALLASAVGENALGEQCRLNSEDGDGGAAQAVVGTTRYRLQCGTWESPSARVTRFESTQTLDVLASSSTARQRLDRLATCEPPRETTILDDVSAVAMDCALRDGGWPYQAVVARLEGAVYFAQSLPASFGATERAIGILSGYLGAEALPNDSAELRRLASRVNSSRYSAGDLASYRARLRLAQYYNFKGLYAEAEAQYRQLIELHESVLQNHPEGLAYLNASLGLQLSNQGRFAEADRVLRTASEQLQVASDDSASALADRAILVSYQAMHAANQRDNARALQLAREATALRREVAQAYGIDLSAATTISTIADVRAAQALRDIVQSLSVEAAMMLEAGQTGGAREVLDEALSRVDPQTATGRLWLAELRIQQARVAKEEGNLRGARDLLTEAIELQRRLYRNGATEARAEIELSTVLSDLGDGEGARGAFLRAFAIKAERGESLRQEDAEPYFQATLAAMRRSPSSRETLSLELFQVAQAVQGSVTAQTLTRTAARLATGDREISLLIRDLEAARRERDRAQQRLLRAEGDPESLPPLLDALETQLAEKLALVEGLERQVQAAAPRYNQLIDKPISVDDVLASLQPGEALLQVLLGEEKSLAFLADGDGVVAYEVPLGEAQVEQRVASLRAAFEINGSLPTFPVDEAHALYNDLLGPVGAAVGGVGPPHHGCPPARS